MHIREIKVDDAENFVNLVKQVENESPFMLMEAGERETTALQQRKQLENLKQQNHSTIFVVEQDDGKLVGYLIAVGGNVRKKNHSAYLVIGITEEHRGKGLGKKLFHQLEQWAIVHQISRLELTVVTENESAVSLYKKVGFEIEGLKRNSLIIAQKYYDEYYMAKLL